MSQEQSLDLHDKIYFERQGKFSLLCGLHALNNLMGRELYTQAQLNGICYQLSDAFINPHKHLFGGQYDVNVMMMALQQQSCDTQWIDARKQFSWDEAVNNRNALGLLICHREQSTCTKKICRIEARHWVCIRLIDSNYVLIDSKAQKPEYLPSKLALEQYCRDKMRAGSEILLVFKRGSS